MIRISAQEEDWIQLGTPIQRLPNVTSSGSYRFGSATASIVLSSRTTATRAPATS